MLLKLIVMQDLRQEGLGAQMIVSENHLKIGKN